MIKRTITIVIGACIVAAAINMAAPIAAFWAEMQPIAQRVAEMARQYAEQ